jgi:hypothetical protein
VSFTVFMQVFFNIVVLTLIFVVFARLRRPAKDDPRLSKGLQLLSSKIAVLEDLNDRTESQVQQMLTLLDQKSRELQQKIMNAESQVLQIQQSMSQSLEVAQIFQDKIPHSEIIERQNSVKYIRAARLAHQGLSVEDIMREVDLPRGEVEFIAKVNRDQLSFREEDLPAWAKDPNGGFAQPSVANMAVAAPVVAAPPVITPPQAEPSSLPAEAAEIVERLNKLQFEMKSLDMELSSRQPLTPATQLQTSAAPAATEKDQLAELGKQFRQAVTTQAPTFSSPPQSAADMALEAARAAASHLRQGEHKPHGASAAVKPTSTAPPSTSGRPPQPAIKRVEFPRI